VLRWVILLAASLIWPTVTGAQTASAPLILEAKIPLGQVSGRVDHLGIDLKRQRLLVAELGNNSLGVVDLAAGKVLRRITGLSEPQGVAYVPFADSVFVANAGDGSVRVLRGEDLTPIGRIELGDDADNVRVNTARNRVLVGYGKGALAVIGPVSLSKTADIRLKGIPRGFRSTKPGPGSLSMCRTRVRSSWPTLRSGRRDRCRRKGRDRIFRWRSTARRIRSWSSFAGRQA
jgi:DNA-binding beta-propeller fold protein YncE